MEIQHVLWATDLFAADDEALPHAAVWARRFGARLTVLHVDESGAWGERYLAARAAYLELAEAIRRRREAEIRGALADLGVDATLEVLPGDPKHVIGDVVASRAVDLVVVCKRTRRGLDRLAHLGSTTARLLRTLDVPVLVVHGDAGARATRVPALRRVLAPVDLAEEDARPERVALELATRLGASLTVAHVVRDVATLAAFTDGTAVAMPQLGELADHCERELRARVEALPAPGAEAHVTIGGDAADTLVDVAAEVGADLIAIPATGKGALTRVLLGSTTERLVRRAPQPVFVMPRVWLDKS